MTICLIVGTRPQIIKSSPIVYESIKIGLTIEIIHTGQHYDYMLSQVFIKDFSLPEPIVNLNIGSGSHVFQTAEIMLGLEKHLTKEKPSLVLIPGDTNSALAGALTYAKLGIPIAHIEAGARCYDMQMAEEINRRLIDHCSELLFAPTANCKKNLKKESVTGEIYLTGDTMYDLFLKFKNRVKECGILNKLNLAEKEYAILTLHRAENVDNPVRLRNILKGIRETKTKIVFPIHPRTRNRLKEQGISLEDTSISVIDSISYVEMLKLLKHAKMVLTDSGGLQKEAFWSKTPCITLRDSTEWIETVETGVNQVAGADAKRITQAIKTVEENYDEIRRKFRENPFGEGNAAKKIVKILKKKIKEE